MTTRRGPPGRPTNWRNMFSDGPALPAAAQDMTVEVRDGDGIPVMQARVMAVNGGEALARASSAHPDTRWVFLRELDREEVDQVIRHQEGTEQHDTAAFPAPPGPAPAGTAQPPQAGPWPRPLRPRSRPGSTSDAAAGQGRPGDSRGRGACGRRRAGGLGVLAGDGRGPGGGGRRALPGARCRRSARRDPARARLRRPRPVEGEARRDRGDDRVRDAVPQPAPSP